MKLRNNMLHSKRKKTKNRRKCTAAFVLISFLFNFLLLYFLAFIHLLRRLEKFVILGNLFSEQSGRQSLSVPLGSLSGNILRPV